MTANVMLDKIDKFLKTTTEYSKVFVYLNVFLSKTISSPQKFFIAVENSLGHFIPISRKI